MYYNTNQLSESELVVANKKTDKQEEVIKNIFIQQRKPLTASDCYNMIPNTLLTSVRRGITNLKNSGIIEKMDERKMGIYGSPEHYYRLVTGQLRFF